jgi:hypothetical protein
MAAKIAQPIARAPARVTGNTPERVRQAAVSAIAPRIDRAAEGRTPALPTAVPVVPALFNAAAVVAQPCTREAVAACAVVVAAPCAAAVVVCAAAVVADVAAADGDPTSG